MKKILLAAVLLCVGVQSHVGGMDWVSLEESQRRALEGSMKNFKEAFSKYDLEKKQEKDIRDFDHLVLLALRELVCDTDDASHSHESGLLRERLESILQSKKANN